MMRPAGRQPGSVPPAVFPVIAAAFIQQIGAALAVTIWPVLGGFGIVLLRFVVAETVLFAVIRPPGAEIDETALYCGVCPGARPCEHAHVPLQRNRA